jgi:hypothetical protein
MSWIITGTQKNNWTPADIDTALWLDAADASTIIESGGAVSQWNDKSGNGRNVAQSIEANKPILLADGIGSKPSLQFDGINDQLVNVAVGLPVGASARSLFIVYRPLQLTGSNTVFSQGTTNSTGQWFALQFRQNPSGDPYFAGYNADLSSGNATTLNSKIAGVTYNGAALTLYNNGTLKNSAARTLNTTGNTVRIGTSPDQAEFTNGLVGEIVMTSSVLSTLDRQKLEGYLAHKWGLTANLPADHPYKTAVPVP